MYRNFVRAPVILLAIVSFIAGCDERSADDCGESRNNLADGQYQAIAKYAASPTADATALAAARATAVESALSILRYCLQGCDTCGDAIINLRPDDAAKVRERASELAVSRVDIGAERDDRKIVLIFLEAEEISGPVVIEMDVRPEEQFKLRVSELIPE
jgi:hypothetical protein